MRRTALLLAVCLLGAARAASAELKGEVKAEAGYGDAGRDSLAATLGERVRTDADLKVRVMWSGDLAGGIGGDAEYQVEVRHGGGVALERGLREALPDFFVDPKKTAALRLDHAITDRGEEFATHGFDRLALAYAGPRAVARLGRQALTWGSGLIFHPMDLFNPFPPNATDTEYKPGTDMFYGQWLFDDGSDVQGAAVPRRDPGTGRFAGAWSTGGIKWHRAGDAVQGDLLVARDYGATVAGAALSGPLRGATWSIELVPARPSGGGGRLSALANIQAAWAPRGKSTNGYLEYFHNGFGAGGCGRALAEYPAALRERLARGRLFTAGRDYLAAGAEVQWTPLLAVKPLLLLNLGDGSALLVGQLVYSAAENLDLVGGLQCGVGPRGTEYGGVETSPGSGLFVAPDRQAYLRMAWYF